MTIITRVYTYTLWQQMYSRGAIVMQHCIV